MISSLRGVIIQSGADFVVVEVGGVGFKVHVPAAVREELAGSGRSVLLHTYLVVRDDALALYGFADEDQRRLFELLLSVSGIGPRLALALLSALSVEAIRTAIAAGRMDVLAGVSGVGRKTAEKIIFALKDKIGAVPDKAAGIAAPAGDVDAEVVAALTALGYSVVEAQAAVQAIPPDGSRTVEERLRLALQYMGRG